MKIEDRFNSKNNVSIYDYIGRSWRRHYNRDLNQIVLEFGSGQMRWFDLLGNPISEPPLIQGRLKSTFVDRQKCILHDTQKAIAILKPHGKTIHAILLNPDTTYGNVVI